MKQSKKLKTFIWQGVNAQGLQISGEMLALNLPTLKEQLRQQAVTLLHVREKKFYSKLFEKKLKPQQILDFTRQLANLVNAHIAIAPALAIIGNSNPQLQSISQFLKTKIESGTPLSEALQHYPSYFDTLYCNLIYVGEQSSTLNIILNQIANYQEKQCKLKNKIKSALIYPGVVMAVAGMVTALLLIVVVPQFQKLFENFGAQLPVYTQIVIKLSNHLKTYGGWIISVVFVLFLAHRCCRSRSQRYAFKIDSLLIKIPWLGTLIIKTIVARFTRTWATTTTAGVALPEALHIIAGSCGNLAYTRAILQTREQILRGIAIHTAISNTRLFPVRVTQMLAIAEESGELATMLNHIADFYEQAVDNSAEQLQKILEPLLMVILGIVIGGLIAAMYLPIFKLGNVL